MTSKRRFQPLLAVLLILAISTIRSASSENSLSLLPLPQPISPSTSSPLEITEAAAHSGVIIHEAGSRKKISTQPALAPITTTASVSSRQDGYNPPASPVNLFMPDEFQFYTLNNNGQLVMKQMTKHEIQSMIAAGGGGAISTNDNFPIDLGYHKTKLPHGEMKVSDVVQNVQNVLKGELNKPVPVHTSSSSIPGNVNSQWTNMLPYILSGGSVDQQDITQDTSIILPSLNDQSYIDVVPLHNTIPGENQYEETNYVQLRPVSNENKSKVVTPKKPSSTSEKPIYLLGNMALDSEILGEQETLTTRNKPSRPTTSTSYPKFTTSRPSLTDDILDVHRLPIYHTKLTQQKKNVTQSSVPTIELATKKAPVYIHSDDTEFTRVTMIPVPVVIADEISTSTQRIHQQQTPIFEVLSTISLEPMTSSTVKDESHPTKVNIGPMGGFKKPGSGHRPSTPYKPLYEPVTRPSLASSYRPIYEPSIKTSSFPTYRPVFEQITQSSTVKDLYRPVYEPVTKPSSEYRPVFEPSSRRPIYDTSVKSTDKFRVTQYPYSYQTLTTGKASSSLPEIVTKPSEGIKVTKISMDQMYTTRKVSSYVTEGTTKPTESTEYEVSTSKISTTAKDTTTPMSTMITKLPEKVIDKDSDSIFITTESLKMETDGETLAPVNHVTEKQTQQSTIFEESETSSPQKSTTEYEEQSTLKESETLRPIIDEKETITPSYETTSMKSLNDGEIKDTTISSILIDSSLKRTTQYPSNNEAFTEYYTTQDDQDGIKDQTEPAKFYDSTLDKQESTTISLKEIDTTKKAEFTEMTTETPKEDKTVSSANEINVTLKQKEEITDVTKQSINTDDKLTTFELNDKITPSTMNYDSQTLKYNDQSTDSSVTEYNVSEIDENKSTVFLLNNNIKSETTTTAEYSNKDLAKNQTDFNLNKEDNVTPINQKVEMFTDSISSIEDKIESIISSLKQDEQMQKNKPSIATTQITIPEDEVSTIKVIPVYDDDTSIYNLPSESPSKTTFTLLSSSISDPSEKDNKLIVTYKTSQSPDSNKSSSIAIDSVTSSYTTQHDINDSNNLPGLQETFNNYMKEHYDPKLSLTESYDEISGLTTFATNDNQMPMDEKTKYSGLSPSMEIDTTEDLKLSSEFSTTPSFVTENSNDLKINEALDLDTETTVFKEIKTTNVPTDEQYISNTMIPDAIDKNKMETPIIYLDLSSPESIKQESSNNANMDLMSNSSFTRIITRNPISDVNKIILEAPAQTNTPPTVYYTLPTNSVPPNNIASGLIAGYPTYNQVKPVTESIPGTTLYDILGGTNKINKNQDPVDSNSTLQILLKEEINKNTNHQEKISSTKNEETTIYNEPTSQTSNYESFTQIPFESLPAVTKSDVPSQNQENYEQTTNSFIPLEKINDLINQLKNTPPDRDIGYEYSNGIATTIVPLEIFESIVNETSSTSPDETLTTMLDNLSKSTSEPQNNTYVIIQTLPPSTPIKTSTESITQTSTTKQPTTIRITTQANSKLKPNNNATTVVSIVKYSSTENPYVTSTYSTTKASFDKVQSTIDKSAGRINLEEEKTKMPPIRPTEPSKFTMKNKLHYTTLKRPVNDGYQSYSRKPTKPISKLTTFTPTKKITTVTSTKKVTSTTTTTTAKPISDLKENDNEKWTLIPQKELTNETEEIKKVSVKDATQQLNPQIVPLDHSTGEIGLDQSNKGLDKDVAEFLNMCNELSFKFWTLANLGLSPSRSLTVSPFGMISTLAMIYLGARGLTSSQMNDILKLDDVVTFNPHLVFQNITDTVTLARGQGIENAAFVRALFADRLKVRRIMPFYKEQAQQFYEGAVVDINFSTAGDILRRRTNLLIRKQTGGRIKDFVKTHTVPLRSPLTALSANVFQTSCDSADASSEGRDGEMYFAVSQTVKQRKLVPIPAVVWKSGVSAGYEPSLDATAVALGDPKKPVSLIMIMPGQQGVTAPGDNLERLENRLFGNPAENTFEKLLKVIIPRRIEVQMPKFSHRSIVNVTSALKRMGFDQMFTKTADLKGINGAGHDLYLADMVQMNLFCTCGDNNKLSERHLSETYPGTSPRHVRAWEVSNNINNGMNDRSDNNERMVNDRPESSETSDSKCDEEDESGDLSNIENLSETTDDVETQNQQPSSTGKRNFDRLSNLRQKIHKNRIRLFTPTKRRRCRQRRQAEIDKPRMKMDKPFLYLIRHNLTGLILHIGRFNPKNQS